MRLGRKLGSVSQSPFGASTGGILLILIAATFVAGESAVLTQTGKTMGMFSRAHKGSAGPSDNGAASNVSRLGDFPLQQTFWKGGSPFVLLGSGVRYYKLGFISVKVYGLAMYVEQNATMAELARLKSQGQFKDGDTSVERMCSVLGALNVTKVVQMHLMRSVSSNQFTDAIAEALKPRLQGTSAFSLIAGFERYFASKSLATDCNIPIMNTGGGLELDLMAPGNTNFAQLSPNETIPSPQFAAALFDIWLAADTPVTGAREHWAEKLKQLIQCA